MRTIASVLLVFGLAASAPANEAAWLTSLPEAQAQAQRENKLVLIDFTGSDWCGWCQKLEADTFSRPEFIDYAAQNLALVRLDFPRSIPQSDDLRAANHALQEQYNVRGFPTVIVMSPDGNVLLQRPGYVPGGPAVLIKALNQCRTQAGLPALADAPPSSPPSAPPVHVKTHAVVPPANQPGAEPKLQGIVYASAHACVILDGKSCEEGESVHGMRVIKIERDKVTVEFHGKVKELTM